MMRHYASSTGSTRQLEGTLACGHESGHEAATVGQTETRAQGHPFLFSVVVLPDAQNGHTTSEVGGWQELRCKERSKRKVQRKVQSGTK